MMNSIGADGYCFALKPSTPFANLLNQRSASLDSESEGESSLSLISTRMMNYVYERFFFATDCRNKYFHVPDLSLDLRLNLPFQSEIQLESR